MPVGSRDFYEVLGVGRSASEDEIRSAYRKLAKQWHPDRHQGKDKAKAEAKIKEINEAYEVLGDPEKRAKYDRFGPLFSQMGGAGGAYGPGGARSRTGPFGGTEGFEDMFRGGGPFGGMGGAAGGSGGTGGTGGFGSILEDLFEELFRKEQPGGRAGARARPPAAEAEVELAVEDAHHGGRKRLTVSQPSTCPVCNGDRLVRNQLCASCGGLGFKTQDRTIEANFPAGVRDGTRLKVGDLSLTVRLKKHPVFGVEGDDLHLELPVAPHEAALGAEVEVPTLDGMVRVNVPAGTSSGKTLRLRGKGLARRDGSRGDLYARVMIVLDGGPSEAERRLYQELAATSRVHPRDDLYRKAKAATTER
ncbi:MAG: DnaJ domain-containing protein [Candidatus Sericytochromatia bacterium]|nr:DnaJ domain-containing protein [Candidatus Tanganyikabacteria bacterium]